MKKGGLVMCICSRSIHSLLITTIPTMLPFQDNFSHLSLTYTDPGLLQEIAADLNEVYTEGSSTLSLCERAHPGFRKLPATACHFYLIDRVCPSDVEVSKPNA